MNAGQPFFAQELARIDADIARLEKSLSEYAPGDPRAAGQRALLQVQRQNRALAVELAAYANDPVRIQMECRIRYMKAARQHARAAQNGQTSHAACSDQWWDTLSQEQYLSDLISRLSAWLLRHASTPSPNGHKPQE
jgi:hypothetical protein